MDLETALERLIENAQEELHIRRHRDQEKTNRADHGHDEAKLLAAGTPPARTVPTSSP